MGGNDGTAMFGMPGRDDLIEEVIGMPATLSRRPAVRIA